MRACAGKRQRHGKSLELRCHLIDLDALNVMDVPTLKRFVTDDGEIMSKRITGLCAKCQRAVATNIKHARNMGIMPHLGQFVLRDGKQQHIVTDFHETVSITSSAADGGSNAKKNVKKIKTKTVVV